MDSVERNDLEWIRRLARRLAASADDADDVVQDTWLAVRKARPDRTRPLRPWLAEVVRNLVRSRFRVGPRRHRRERTFHELQAPEVPPPDVAHARDQVHRIVAERAQALDEPLRTIVRLRFFEDKSSTEIAAELGVPAGTVRWRLKTAMDQLRSDLDGRFEGDRRAWAVLVAPAVGAGAGKAPRTLSPLLGASLVGGTLALVAGLIALVRLSTPTPGPSAAIGVEPAAARPLAAGLPRPPAGPALEPAAGLAEVEGVVLDPEGGPVAGAAVLAIRQSDGEELPEDLSEHVPAGHSDRNGNFHLPRLAPGRYAISATGRGFTPGWTELVLRPGQRQVGVRLTVAGKGVELTGRLTDSGGGPIAGGRVSAHSVLDDLRSGPSFSVPSDREGHYRLVLPAGEYAVQAMASGYAGQGRDVPLFVPTRHDFHLHPGARIAGRVEGPPGPGEVEVRAFGQPGGRGEVKPDGAGEFLFDSLSPGVYVIEARRGAAVGRSGEIAVGAGGSRTDVTIHLQPMPLLRGHVRTQDGRPIARAFVTAGVELGASREAGHTLAHTDDRGTFTLEGVWPGKVSLRANALGFASEVRVLALVEGVTPPAIELVLQPDSQVRGQVLDPAGAPAPFARLTLITRSGDPGRDGARLHTLTDRRGRFSVDGLAGILEVRADHAAGLGSAGPVQLVPGSPASVEVRLRPGAFVSGVVRREDGTPALGAHVRGRLRGTAARTSTTGTAFQTWVAREPPPAETAADGSFRIGPFDSGEVAIRASVPDVPGFFTTDPRPDSKWLHLAAGEERTGVVLVLDPAEGQIAGQVVQEDGQPLAGALVSGLPEQDGIAAVPESARAVAVLSGADGRFTLSRLRRGRYTLRVSHPELPPAEKRHVPPGTTDLTLRMAKGAALTGVVVGTDGRAVTDYALVATVADHDGESNIRMYRRLAGLDARRLTVRDPGGRFTLTDLPPGRYDLGITTARGASAMVRGLAVVAGGREDLRIALSRGAVIRGRVVDAITGAPIARASIEGQGAALDLRTTADDRGAFALAGVPRDPAFELHVFGAHDAYMREIVLLTVAEGAAIDLGAVRVQPGGINHTFRSPGMPGFLACTRDGRTAVRQVGPDSAARAAGLRAGDRIVSVDGRSMAGASGSMVQALAMGPVGAPLDLVVETPGVGARAVRVVRKVRNRTAVTER